MTKQFVDYPIAKSLDEAISWLEQGNECWQEISDEYPERGGFETVGELRYNFPDGLDETDNMHLVISDKNRVPCKYPMSEFHIYEDEVPDGVRVSTPKDCEICDYPIGGDDCRHCLIWGEPK